MGQTTLGKGSKIIAVADGAGLPVAVYVASASPHETTLIRATLESRFTRALPERLIGDKAYDSDALDRELAERGIELIAPHKRVHKRNRVEESYAGRQTTPAVPQAMEDRAIERLAAELPARVGQARLPP